MEQGPTTGGTPEQASGAPEQASREAEPAAGWTDPVSSSGPGAPPPPPVVSALPEPPMFAPEPVAPVTGWSVPAADPRATGPDRPIDFILPLVVLLVTAGGLTALRLSNATTGYSQGYVLGTTIGALVLAGVFYLVARRFGGPRGRRRARIIASGIPVLVMILGSFSQVAAPQARLADPQSAMVMGAPFQLVAAPDAVVAKLTGETAAGVWAIKQVNRGTTAVGYLLATGAGSSEPDDQFWPEFDKGATNSGSSAAPTTIGTVSGRMVTGNGFVGLAWRTDVLSVQVVAVDEASARAIAAAQMGVTSSPSP